MVSLFKTKGSPEPCMIYLKMTSPPKALVQIKKRFQINLSHNALYQICTNDFAPSNKRATKALDKK